MGAAKSVEPDEVQIVNLRREGNAVENSDGIPGKPAGRVAWYVLGQGESLKEFARWTQQRPQDAAAHLAAALGVLVGHYGLGEVRTTPVAA